MADNPQPISPGEAALALIVNMPQWIYRRQETILLQDNGETRRQISFDYEIPVGQQIHPFDLMDPEHLPLDVPRDGTTIVPLSFMQKGNLVDLDVRDESGAALPVVTTKQNGDLVLLAIEMLLEKICDDSTSEHQQDMDECLSACRDVVFSRSAGGRASESADENRRIALHNISSATVTDDLACDHKPINDEGIEDEGIKDIQVLLACLCKARNNPSISSTARLLAALLAAMSQFYVFAVVLPSAPHARHVTKITYSAKAVRERSPKRVRQALSEFFLAYRSVEIAFSPASADSTHLEIHTNPALAITQISDTPAGTVRLESDSKVGQFPPDKSQEDALRNQVVATTGQVHLKYSAEQGWALRVLKLKVVHVRSGPIWYALLASCLNVVLQFLFFFWLIPQLSSLALSSARGTETLDEERLFIIRDANAITAATLVLSVAIALAVVIQNHEVHRHVTIAPRIIMVISAGLFSLMLLYASYDVQVGRGIFPSTPIPQILLVLSVVTMVWAGALFMRASDKSDAKPRVEVGSTPLVIRRESGVAATESALFESMNPDLVRSLREIVSRRGVAR